MQVFMPLPNYKDSVHCLDNSRLGNQIYREVKTLISGGWLHHPAAKMWKNYKYSLCDYALAGLDELKSRGRYYPKWFKYFREIRQTFENTGLPPFINNEKYHASHRSNLLRKDKEYYSQFGWSETDNLPYVWPISEE